MEKKRYILIGCEVVKPEVEAIVARGNCAAEILYVDQGLHSVGKIKMPQQLQEIIDGVDQSQYEAILLMYGICNYGILGLHADIPIVVPRAHDCITFFLGSKEEYRSFFDEHPGTMFFASGWDQSNLDSQQEFDLVTLREKYVEEFGEDNADYLMEMMGAYTAHYSKMSFINTGTGEVEKFRSLAKQIAEDSGWEFIEKEGSTRLFEMMLSGDWNDSDFLIIQPGEMIAPTYRDDIIKAVARA